MLKQFLDNPAVDVPLAKKDISLPQNVLWLARNLGIRNSQVEGYQEAMAELKILLKSF